MASSKSPLTPKQEGHLNECLSHGGSCGQILSILRAIGAPNEALEAQQQYVVGTATKAKELVEEYKRNPPQG